MKKNFLIYISVFLASVFFVGCDKYEGEGTQLPAPIENNQSNTDLVELLESTNWVTTEVAPGIVWKYYHFTNLLGSRQYVTLFDIDLNDPDIKIEIPYVTSGFLKTSAAAEQKDADVAFNGSYFNTSTGGSTVYFKTGGNVINQTRSGFNPYRENGAFTLSSTGKAEIVQKPSGGWGVVGAANVLAGGPLLIVNGEKVLQQNVEFNINRHPRTVMGLTGDNHLLAVVVDGRSRESQGLSTIDLSELMFALGCVSAVNMDGGGSSTAWVKGEGVVNHPTDNGKFDHEGERGVATVFTVKAQ
ncbi:phosphodiester glycosidase family protein [Sphingobacterium sp. SGG-5]|uniref:phosphodiester glycosidase family protein n=1 Tax=Sphingobacterium sp. SGG-5 TaxID=2710881 RepID=UPI0013E9E748|nr:phosphodiester glycosidase family protein [Sphingobacterium sp. SGG-5]NGM62045.1 phosphodiester glycosidase family protein [Sphingobacterium sp. SGG-5]